MPDDFERELLNSASGWRSCKNFARRYAGHQVVGYGCFGDTSGF